MSVSVVQALSDLLKQVDARCEGRCEGNSPLAAAAGAAREALSGVRRREFYVVVTERDIDLQWLERHKNDPTSTYESWGPIVHEQYVNKSSYAECEQRARVLGDRYGWTRIARVIVEDWPEETK